MINIALVGDHALNVHALASLFSASTDIHVSSVSSNLRMLKRAIGAPTAGNAPHVVVLDVNFELRPALQAISLVRTVYSDRGVIILGLTRDKLAITRLLQAGATFYLSKNTETGVLENVLRLTANRNFQPSAEERGESIQNSGAAEDAVYQAWLNITPMEYQYFKLAISEMSNGEIRRMMQMSQSAYARLIGQIHRRFNVKSREGLALALFRQRWLVRDDL